MEKKMKKSLSMLILSWSLVTGFNANAQGVDHSSHGASHAENMSATSDQYTKAVVRKIDKQNGKITLKHEEIKNLDMPSMTMVFVLRLKDTSVLDSVTVGDEVNAVFDKTTEGFVVTELLKK